MQATMDVAPDSLETVVILAGGKGARLRSVVRDRPKAMAVVAGRPFAEWLLMALRDRGVRCVIFCTGYLGGMIEEHFGDGRGWGLQIAYSRDPIPLGTGGAVRHALDQIAADRFVVMNGDSFCPVDLAHLAEAHMARHAWATLWLVRVGDCRRFGSVVIDPHGDVLEFREKSQERGAGLINAGIYMLERDAVRSIPEGCAVSIESEFFPRLIGHGLSAVVGEGPFIDIGTPEAYAQAGQYISGEMPAKACATLRVGKGKGKTDDR